eukprot:14159627-Ditylum_brightwellii.AAC.1
MAGPYQQLKVKYNDDMFLNNAMLLHNSNKFNTPAETLMQQTQHNVEIWGRLFVCQENLESCQRKSYHLTVKVPDANGCTATLAT